MLKMKIMMDLERKIKIVIYNRIIILLGDSSLEILFLM